MKYRISFHSQLSHSFIFMNSTAITVLSLCNKTSLKETESLSDFITENFRYFVRLKDYSECSVRELCLRRLSASPIFPLSNAIAFEAQKISGTFFRRRNSTASLYWRLWGRKTLKFLSPFLCEPRGLSILLPGARIGRPKEADGAAEKRSVHELPVTLDRQIKLDRNYKH